MTRARSGHESEVGGGGLHSHGKCVCPLIAVPLLLPYCLARYSEAKPNYFSASLRLRGEKSLNDPTPSIATITFMPNEVYAIFDTTEGRFKARLFADRVPKTVENFTSLAEGT